MVNTEKEKLQRQRFKDVERTPRQWRTLINNINWRHRGRLRKLGEELAGARDSLAAAAKELERLKAENGKLKGRKNPRRKKFVSK